MPCHHKCLASLSTQPCWHPTSPQNLSLTPTAALWPPPPWHRGSFCPVSSSYHRLSHSLAWSRHPGTQQPWFRWRKYSPAWHWGDAACTWDVNKLKHPQKEKKKKKKRPPSHGIAHKSLQYPPLTKDDARISRVSLLPLLFLSAWHERLRRAPIGMTVWPPTFFSACPHIPSLLSFLSLSPSSSMSPPLPISHPHPCSSLNDNILVIVAFVFLGPGAWICQDAFPARRLRGLLLRGNLGSLLRQLNPLTLCFLIKITLWLIRQKEGPSPSLALPPPPPPPPSLSSCSVSRQVWLQPVTDVPHCQAAKDVLADAVAWPACQAPGLQAARERGTERKRGKKQNRRSRDRRNHGKESECKDRPGMWQDREIKRRDSRHSRDCDEPSGRLTGRAPGRPYWSGELCCSAYTHSRSRGGDKEAWSGESSLPTVVQGAGIQEPILISSVWAATRGPFISQVEW